MRALFLAGIIAVVTLAGAGDAASQEPRPAIIQQAPHNEQRWAPEDKNRNGWLCEDPGIYYGGDVVCGGISVGA